MNTHLAAEYRELGYWQWKAQSFSMVSMFVKSLMGMVNILLKYIIGFFYLVKIEIVRIVR